MRTQNTKRSPSTRALRSLGAMLIVSTAPVAATSGQTTRSQAAVHTQGDFICGQNAGLMASEVCSSGGFSGSGQATTVGPATFASSSVSGIASSYTSGGLTIDGEGHAYGLAQMTDGLTISGPVVPTTLVFYAALGSSASAQSLNADTFAYATNSLSITYRNGSISAEEEADHGEGSLGGDPSFDTELLSPGVTLDPPFYFYAFAFSYEPGHDNFSFQVTSTSTITTDPDSPHLGPGVDAAGEASGSITALELVGMDAFDAEGNSLATTDQFVFDSGHQYNLYDPLYDAPLGVPVVPTPEPSTLILFASGMVGIAALRFHRRRSIRRRRSLSLNLEK